MSRIIVNKKQLTDLFLNVTCKFQGLTTIKQQSYKNEIILKSYLKVGHI